MEKVQKNSSSEYRRLEDQKTVVRIAAEICLSSTAFTPASCPTNLGPPFSWVKRPGREAGYLPPPTVAIKNAWSHTSTPPCCSA
jgi:hypothetical protein